MNNNFNLQLYSIISTDFSLKSLQSRYTAPLGNNVDFELEYYTHSDNDFSFEVYSESESESESEFDNQIDSIFNTTSQFENKFNTSLVIDFESEIKFLNILSQEIVFSFDTYSNLKAIFINSREFIGNLDFNLFSEFVVYVDKYSINSNLIVLSPDLEILAYLENYNDFVWNRRWRKIDDFELSINTGKPVSRYLRTDNYIAMKRGDIVHAGKIKNREIKKDANGEFITVSGKGLGEILENRIAFNDVNVGSGFDTFNGSAESAMKYYVDVNVKNPDDARRKINRLVIDRDREKGKVINYNARFQKISEILYEIAKTSGLGWDVQLDLENKEFVFKVISAKIRQSIRLNPDFDSVKMIDFKEHNSNSETTILVAGQGSGADRDILEVSRNEVGD